MAELRNTIHHPQTGKPVVGAKVTIHLVASVGDPGSPGWDPANDREVRGTTVVKTDDDGAWSVDLQPNDEITPANTYYEVVEDVYGDRRTHYVVVPDAVGPHHVYDILVTPPESLPTVHESNPNAHTAGSIEFEPGNGFVSDNAQDAIVEASALSVAAAAAFVDAEAVAREAADDAESTARADADALLIPLAQKAAADGVAPLGADLLVPAVHAPRAAFRAGLSTVLFGDSFVGMNGGPERKYFTDRGWFNVLNCRMGKRFRVVKNSGIGGDTAANMVTRLEADVLDYNPDVVIMDGGSIDIAASTPLATVKAYILGMIETMVARNITVVHIGTPPVNGMTQGMIDNCFALTNWLRDLSLVEPGLVYVDTLSAYLDPTTGLPPAAGTYSWDGDHPNPTGAVRIADNVYRQLQSGPFRGAAILPQTDGDNQNLLLNGFMTGNVGGVATSWSLTGGVTTPTKQARADYVRAEWQRITITSGNPSLLQDVTLAAAGLVVGDSVRGVAEFAAAQATPAFIVLHQFALLFFNGAVLLETWGDLQHNPPGQAGADGNVAALVPSGVFETPAIVIPANTTKIRVGWSPHLGAGGVADISRIGLYKV